MAFDTVGTSKDVTPLEEAINSLLKADFRRLESKQEAIGHRIAALFPEDLLKSSSCQIINYFFAGGQLLPGMIDRLRSLGLNVDEILDKVIGFESPGLYIGKVQEDIHPNLRVFHYSDKFNSLLHQNKNMSFVAIGNPPYTEANKGKSALYDRIIMDLNQKVDLTHQAWIIPTSWYHNPAYAKFREILFANGLKRVELLPAETFKGEAVVETCLIYCERDYTGLITYAGRGSEVEYDFRSLGVILPVRSKLAADLMAKMMRHVLRHGQVTFTRSKNPSIKKLTATNAVHEFPFDGCLTYLDKIRKTGIEYKYVDQAMVAAAGVELNLSDVEYHRIATNDMARDKDAPDWGIIEYAEYIPPGVVLNDNYHYIVVDSKAEALQLRRYLKSTLMSWTLFHTRSARTVRNTQFKFMPKAGSLPTGSFTWQEMDDWVYQVYDITEEERSMIEHDTSDWRILKKTRED